MDTQMCSHWFAGKTCPQCRSELSSLRSPRRPSALLPPAFGAHFEQSPPIALEHGVALHIADAATHGGEGFAGLEGDRFVAGGIERQARFCFQGAFGATMGAQAALDAGAFLKQQRAIGGAPQRASRSHSGGSPCARSLG